MQDRKQIGLAIVGCGTIGRIRAELARAYPGIGWIGLCDLKSDIGQKLADDIQADFFTTDYRELLQRQLEQYRFVSEEIEAIRGIRCSSRNRWRPTLANPPRSSLRSTAPGSTP